MVGVFDDPLPETLIMEEMFARKESGLGHVLETDHTSVVVMFLDFFLINFFEVLHGISKFLNPIIRPTITTRNT